VGDKIGWKYKREFSAKAQSKPATFPCIIILLKAGKTLSAKCQL
jgi:hypothetical protein